MEAPKLSNFQIQTNALGSFWALILPFKLSDEQQQKWRFVGPNEMAGLIKNTFRFATTLRVRCTHTGTHKPLL